MKKNMISILILALLIVDVVLSGIMMFSVIGTTKKTAKLIDGISTALSLEIKDPTAEAQNDDKEIENVPMKDIAVYKIEDQMTIPLAKGVDGKDHFCQVSISLSMNSKDKGFKEYGETISEKEDLIKGEIVSVISNYTIEEAESDQDSMRKEILSRIQAMYDSQFVYNVIFRDIMFQ